MRPLGTGTQHSDHGSGAWQQSDCNKSPGFSFMRSAMDQFFRRSLVIREKREEPLSFARMFLETASTAPVKQSANVQTALAAPRR